MAIQYLKKAEKNPATGESETREIVSRMLDEIEKGGEAKARQYGEDLDGWTGDIVVGPDAISAAADQVTDELKDDIRFSFDRVRTFAEHQRASIQD
ncbi:MAG: histidinol dehydrogenase, partial [Alphaproteobacteria bacterium]|nr:histidinol dehydrogenase [Alphaproteobacteria bacterium]